MRRSGWGFIGLAIAAALLWMGAHTWLTQPRAAIAAPPVVYVAPNGNDRNDGSQERPWATVNHAAAIAQPGQTVYIRGGTYSLTAQIRAQRSGTASQPITYTGYPGETVILDADAIEVPAPTGKPPFPHDQGAFQLENIAYITLKNLTIKNSHNSGITVRNSHHINLINNTTENSFAPGIGAWSNRPNATYAIKILGNTVINANDPSLGYPGSEKFEPPHESISLGSVNQFEVAYNLVRDGQKEGIDVKEASQEGTVHHNVVHRVKRQGLYVDSWSGVLRDVEVFNNIVYGCGGAGFVISVEDGIGAKNIEVHHNLLYDNWGTGVLFGRWGKDGPRENIKIHHNTIHHNGHGKPSKDKQFYWITGGIYFFSNNLKSVEVSDNIVSQNAGFQIGYSDRYFGQTPSDPTALSPAIQPIFQAQNIQVKRNLIDDRNTPAVPIEAGWLPDNWATIYPLTGDGAIKGDPQFIAPQDSNFYLQATSPAIRPDRTAKGAFPPNAPEQFWWQRNFPPRIPDPS